MAISANDFWGTDYYKNPKLTGRMVERAQRVLGVTLPVSLVALLNVQNGGYTRGFVFPTETRTSWAPDHVPVRELFGIGAVEGRKGRHNILDSAYMTEEWGLPPAQVLLAGDGHWWITLDYRKGLVPSVTWIDTDLDVEMQLAVSFDAFLSVLLPESVVDAKTCTVRRMQ